MTPEQLTELEALAKAASAGPWVKQYPHRGDYGYEVAKNGGVWQVCAQVNERDAAYIAALDPTTALELIRMARASLGGEPVGVVHHWNVGGSGEHKSVEGSWRNLPPGTKLYTHSPDQSARIAELEAVLQRIAAYPKTRDDELSYESCRALAKQALMSDGSKRDG